MIIFDMDGTICHSKQKISPAMKKALGQLGEIVVISGATKKQMEYQLDGLPCVIFSQNGNENPFWKNKLTPRHIFKVYNHIKDIKKYAKPHDPKIELTQNRGSQISFSMVGHDAPNDVKAKFDKGGKYRRGVLAKHPFRDKELTCKIGGTTCLDYILKTGTKGENIRRFLRLKRIERDECVYYGDALFEGGNDESVVGVIKTIQVEGPEDLLQKLNGL